MNVEIKAPTKIDSSKSAVMHYCDSCHNIPVLLKGVTTQDLKQDNKLQYIHQRLVSLVNTFDSLYQEPVTHITLEIA